MSGIRPLDSPSGSCTTAADRPVRLLIIASVRLHRESLAHVLSQSPGVELVGIADAATPATQGLEVRDPDVVLVDVPSDRRAATIRAVLDAAPTARVVAFGLEEVEAQVIDIAVAGAAGYVSDQCSVGDLVRAVRAAWRDELLCSPKMAATLLRRVGCLPTPSGNDGPAPAEVEALTPREVEVLHLIESGLSNKQIARRLHIALPTVKNHVHNILQKLQVRSRTEALARLRVNPSGVGGGADSTEGSARASSEEVPAEVAGSIDSMGVGVAFR